MKLRTDRDSVSIQNIYDDKDATRLLISEVYSGAILSAYVYPYVGYIAEWKNNSGTWRTFLALPKHNTKAWLDDLVREKAEEKTELVGIINLDDVKLEAYVVPEDYRKFIGGEGSWPDWYDA